MRNVIQLNNNSPWLSNAIILLFLLNSVKPLVKLKNFPYNCLT